MACDTPPLKTVKTQGELSLPSLSPILSLNSTIFLLGVTWCMVSTWWSPSCRQATCICHKYLGLFLLCFYPYVIHTRLSVHVCDLHEIMYRSLSAFLYTASGEKLVEVAGNEATHILQCSYFSPRKYRTYSNKTSKLNDLGKLVVR